MKYEIRYKPAFAAIFLTLEPGEHIVAEAGSLVSMAGDLTLTTELAGGLVSAILRWLLGGESLFVNVLTNRTDGPRQVVLSQQGVGDIEGVEFRSGASLCFQPGAYLASTPRIRLGVRWAGLNSWLAGEGLFRLQVQGRGLVFFGAYGGLTRKRITDSFVVDTGHLVAYEPQLQFQMKFANGLVGAIVSGEGRLNHIKGDGLIYLQSRSIKGLMGFLRKRIEQKIHR